VESLGRIQDRTQEHLGKTDVGIIKYRRMMRAAIDNLKNGKTDALPMMNGVSPADIYGPVSNDTIAMDGDWRGAALASDEERRANCSGWAATISS